MVECMDYTEDVERLFSWLKAPMVHYREFAPQAEVAEAVATWPLMHRAAVQTGVAAADAPAPHGFTAVRERLARERMTLPEGAQRAIEGTPLVEPLPPDTISGQPTPGRLSDRPSGDPLMTALGQRLQAEHIDPPAPQPAYRAPPAAEMPLQRPDQSPPPMMHSFEEPVGERLAAVAPPSSEGYPARDRGALLGGEYRGRERDTRAGPSVADRHDRSLDAVFSRLAGGRDRLPDPRSRARTSPGLGGVFGRLR
jgi:hypothetical protein